MELIYSMCSTSILPYRMVVPGVPRMSLVGTVAIIAPLSRTAVGSSRPVGTSCGWVWVRTSLRSWSPSVGGDEGGVRGGGVGLSRFLARRGWVGEAGRGG